MKQVRKGKIVAMVGFLGLFAGVLLSACSKPKHWLLLLREPCIHRLTITMKMN